MSTTQLGSLQSIFQNNEVHEICANHFDNIYYAEKNELKFVKDLFKDQNEFEHMVSDLFKSVGREQDHTKIQHLTLECGTRVAIVGKELNNGSTAFNMMKPIDRELNWDELIKFKAITKDGLDIIKNIIAENANILLAGQGGSGLYTVVNNVFKLVPEEFRTVSVERVREFNISRPHHLSLTSYQNEVTSLKDLSEGTRYLRADYLFYGQTHGPELPAMFDRISENSSVIAITNSESPLEALQKIEFQMLAQETVYDIELIRGLVSRSFNYVIFTDRNEEGSRRIAKIIKIEGYDLGKYLTTEVYSA